jgi:hypothetical protein
MNTQNLQTKMSKLRKLNMWNMIVTISFQVLAGGLIFAWFLTVGLQLGFGTNINPDDLNGYQIASIFEHSIIFIILLLILMVGQLVVLIMTAVKNNDDQIRNVYRKIGLGLTPGIISIVQIFAFQWILSIILFVITSKPLQTNFESLSED